MRSDGDGSQSRDMCYVDNVVDACVKSATRADPLNAECYNVACGERTTNKDILAYLKKKYPDAVHHDAPWRPGDVMHTQADLVKIHSDLGYVPLIKIWEGIDRTIEWIDSNWDSINKMRLSK